MRAHPDHDADQRDRRPQPEHRAPVEQAQDAAARVAPGFALAARPGGARLSHARRIFVVGIGSFTFGRWFLRRLVVAGDAILRAEAQFRKRCGEPELRLPASAALFSSPRHTQRPRHARIPQKWIPVLRTEYAPLIKTEHFLTANRTPLCRKMLCGTLASRI